MHTYFSRRRRRHHHYHFEIIDYITLYASHSTVKKKFRGKSDQSIMTYDVIESH